MMMHFRSCLPKKLYMNKLMRPLIAGRRSYHPVALPEGPVVDFRADTVTKPSKAMLDAMYNAEVGDDFFREDPSVNRLEKKCADIFGMEDALFVTTTTMGNLICSMTHCQGRGQEILIGHMQHSYVSEQANIAQFGSIAFNIVENQPDGTMKIDAMRKAIHKATDFNQEPVTKVICLENTHMYTGGMPLPLDFLKSVAQLAKENNVAVHVDGARIYNAAVASNVEVKDLLTGVDSVSMCLTKGIGCPVGAVIGGSKEFIRTGLRLRTALGGSSCQTGYIAAPAVVALETAMETITEDHRRAQVLAHTVEKLDQDVLSVNVDDVKTNIIFAKTKKDDAERISGILAANGVLTSVFDDSTLRFVTHLDINDEDIEVACDAIKKSVIEAS